MSTSLKWRDAGKLRILDFDTESLAAGFADPEWVPQKITCCAWSWVGEDVIHVRATDFAGFFQTERRGRMLKPFLAAVRQADLLTGHNINRHDLGVINAESIRCGFGSLPSLLIQDTMRLPKTKGLKKGQDNLSELFDVPAEKMTLSWQGWDDAYAEPGWPRVKERCRADVAQNKLLRAELLERGLLGEPFRWHPFRGGARRLSRVA